LAREAASPRVQLATVIARARTAAFIPGNPFTRMSIHDSYPGFGGFIPGSRGSLMLDVVFLAMFVVVPLLTASVLLVKYRRQYDLHKKLQLAMAGVLLVAVLLFEVDIRVNGWEQRAAASPFFDPVRKWTCPAGLSLVIHLSFAVPTLVLWVIVVARALRNFSRPPRPGAHSRWHSRWGFIAAAGMLMTAVTGWLFYWLAFMAQERSLG
jgi:putative membrane protein